MTHGCGDLSQFACESGLSEPEIGLEHAFVLLIWQRKHDKWQNSHGARLKKHVCKLLSLSFDLTRESVSTAFDRVCDIS
jgi:hypothetical protein